MRASTIESLTDRLPGDAANQISGRGEIIIWRHQNVGDRRPEADNAMGTDPDGTTWTTEDRYREANRQRSVFYCQFVPVRGDHLITLQGAPQTKAEAKGRPEVARYKVTSTEAFRTDDGRLTYCKAETELDRSGQW